MNPLPTHISSLHRDPENINRAIWGFIRNNSSKRLTLPVDLYNLIHSFYAGKWNTDEHGNDLVFTNNRTVILRADLIGNNHIDSDSTCTFGSPISGEDCKKFMIWYKYTPLKRSSGAHPNFMLGYSTMNTLDWNQSIGYAKNKNISAGFWLQRNWSSSTWGIGSMKMISLRTPSREHFEANGEIIIGLAFNVDSGTVCLVNQYVQKFQKLPLLEKSHIIPAVSLMQNEDQLQVLDWLVK